MERPESLETARLVLVTLRPVEIEALIAGDVERASEQTGAVFPAGWPNDRDARDGLSWHLRALQSDPNQRAWRIRVIVERASNRVIGSINLKGPPGDEGDVEIGWGLIEEARGRGYALEAASAVMAWAGRQPAVTSISATVPDDNERSQRLAARLGLVRCGLTRRHLPLWTKGKLLDLGEADRAAVAETTATLLAAVNRSDLAAVMAIWSDDGVMMPPHHPSVHGRADIEEYFDRLFRQYRAEFRFPSTRIEVSGDLAVERVEYHAVITPIDGSVAIRDQGKGVHVYRRLPAGAWKLAMDIWNSDRA
jgi:uncharacterized protein (TIGR02246 family)